MINALIIKSSLPIKCFADKVRQHCPQINSISFAQCIKSASKVINEQKANLIFLPVDKIDYLNDFPSVTYELICFGESRIKAFEAIKHNAIGFLVPPIRKEDLVLNINKAFQRLQQSGSLKDCLLYTSPSPRDQRGSRMPSSA